MQQTVDDRLAAIGKHHREVGLDASRVMAAIPLP
jgi:hypothetical protein